MGAAASIPKFDDLPAELSQDEAQELAGEALLDADAFKEAWKEVAANRKAAGVKKQKLSDDEKKSDKAALLARFERCRDGEGGLTAAVVTTLGQQFSAFRLTMHVTRLLLRAMRLAERSIVPAMMRPPPKSRIMRIKCCLASRHLSEIRGVRQHLA